MLWFSLSLFTALTVAARDVSMKALFPGKTAWEILGYELFWGIPFFTLGCLLTPLPPMDRTFYWSFLTSLPLNWVAYLLYVRAIISSPLGLSVPFLAFTPVFMLLPGYFFLNETVTWWGAVGIFLIIIGSYVLNFKKSRQEGVFAPFKALAHEPGSRYMLMVAFLYGFASIIDKKAMIHSSPLFFGYFFSLIFNVTLLSALFLTGRVRVKTFQDFARPGIWLGALAIAQASAHCLAISLVTAVYMIAVKRTSILFSILLGWLLLGEKDILTRGMGALLMFLGVLLISFSG